MHRWLKLKVLVETKHELKKILLFFWMACIYKYKSSSAQLEQ